MAERLAGGSAALALLANSLATGGALVAILLALGPVSGAHLNPAVTLAEAWRLGTAGREVAAYLGAQLVGALGGVALAHAMFSEPLLTLSRHPRAGGGQLLGEAIATFGLLATIRGCARSRPGVLPFAVASYITAAYWFTSSTSFANPVVTLARAFTDTFTGIRLADVPGFILAQLVGAVAATALFAWFDAWPARVPLERAAPDPEAQPSAPGVPP